MISALLLIFVLQFVIHLVNNIGKQTVNDLLWLLFTKLPSSHSKEASEFDTLRRDVVRINREMNATSAQDEFAKWAKLRRQHDKAKDKYDVMARNQQSFKTNFDRAVSAARWLGTQGVTFLANFYYGKDPMFWLPQGWVPYQVEWILSCPRAPLGSISVNVWTIACASVAAMISELVIALVTLQTGKVQAGARRGEKLKMEAPLREKKEL